MPLPDWFYDAMARVKPDRPKRPKRPRPDRPRPERPDPVEPDEPIAHTTAGGKIASCGAQMVAQRCRYVAASAGPCDEGFDCAGLTNYCVQMNTGWHIGRSGEHQLWQAGGEIIGTDGFLNLAMLRPGDILFWDTGVVHTGIYAGDGRMHNALNSSQGLATSVIRNSPYWGSSQARYLGARRFA